MIRRWQKLGLLYVPAVAASGYAATATTFDGSTNYTTRGADLTGNADGKKGILSFWFKINGGDGLNQRVFNTASNGNNISLLRLTSGTFRLLAKNSSTTTRLNISTVATYAASSTWHHFLASWDMATSGFRYIYVDDAADLTVTTFTDDTLDYTDTNWSWGAHTDGSSACAMDFCEGYLNLAESIDITVAGNRRLFDSGPGAGSHPISLGSNGSTATGTAPIIYFKTLSSAIGTNAGTGGDFTGHGAFSSATPP